jgi:hypothetical protein
MRAALVDRAVVKYPQARGLEARGLATAAANNDMVGGWHVTLTDTGEAARAAILAPLVPGVRVRHTLHGKVGRVVRVESTYDYDVVTLVWDGSEVETCGTPAYLMVEPPKAESDPEVFDPFWVRNLVDRVGRELHDMDMLAAACAEGEQAPWAYQRGQRDTWAAAADYLQSAVQQSVAHLGLAELLDASRAGASMAELVAIPQSREV